MASSNIAAIQKWLSNALDESAVGENLIAGVIGDAPSQYSKSPQLWNAAFQRLGMKAIYLPFDVDDRKLGDLLAALKRSDRFLGVKVPVPHKLRVMGYLDELDRGAGRIGAVNTIVRGHDGRLIGFNTDGEGFIETILTRQPDRAKSFLTSLKGMSVLLLGAGGSARAVAFHLADLLEGGQLILCNRTLEHATSLVSEVKKDTVKTIAIDEQQLTEYAPRAGLIVNCTTKGQGGSRALPNGGVVLLEPYSALAPAHPSRLSQPVERESNDEAKRRITAGSDIDANNLASIALARSIPAATRFYDLVYHPEETVFLRHGRLTGHPTMNGKAMIVNQAVIAFCKRICAAELQTRGSDAAQLQNDILEVMYHAW